MTSQPISITWELGRDKFGRRVTLTREGQEYTIRTHPDHQRDDGEIIRSLSKPLLEAAGAIVREQR